MPSVDDWIGQVIDNRYRIVELLGEGGMGAVFAAEHLKLRKQVALKIIRAEVASNPVIEARFAREATATSKLEHPHVASAIDYGTLPDGGAFLVTQLVRGVSLARQLDRGRMRWAVAADLAAQVADALAAAHAAGIVHRDLKPDNILVETRDDGKFHVKVVDFGIARLTEEAIGDGTLRPLTRMGAIIGTPGYMAPEQAVGEPVDARGDLYALGVIVWECCVGRRLWTGDGLAELVACQLAGSAPTLQQELGSQVPAALSELVARLLAAAPSQRPDAAAPVRDALRQIAAGQPPTAATLPASFTTSTSTAALPMSIRPATAPGWTTSSRGRRGLAFAGVALISLAIVLLAVTGGGDESFVAEADEDAEQEEDAAIADEAPPVAGGEGGGAPVAAPPVAAPPVATPAGPTTPPPEPAAPPVAVEPPAADAGEPAEVDAGEPEAGEGEPPEQLEPETTPAAPVVTPKGALEVPAALVRDVTLLASGDSRKVRKRAASRVIGFKPKAEVPLFALNVAWLEKAGSCGNKRTVIEKIQTDGDPRALPALRRLSRVRRSGCGWFNVQDCLGCLRGTLAHAIAYLEGRAAAQK